MYIYIFYTNSDYISETKRGLIEWGGTHYKQYTFPLLPTPPFASLLTEAQLIYAFMSIAINRC